MPDVLGNIKNKLVIQDRVQSFKEAPQRWKKDGILPSILITRLQIFGRNNARLAQKITGGS